MFCVCSNLRYRARARWHSTCQTPQGHIQTFIDNTSDLEPSGSQSQLKNQPVDHSQPVIDGFFPKNTIELPRQQPSRPNKRTGEYTKPVSIINNERVCLYCLYKQGWWHRKGSCSDGRRGADTNQDGDVNYLLFLLLFLLLATQVFVLDGNLHVNITAYVIVEHV